MASQGILATRFFEPIIYAELDLTIDESFIV